jgi:heme O synthase-like polyprenyltransferase
LAGAYVLPWYSAWGFPLLALVWSSRVAAASIVQSALISVAYAAPLVLGPAFGTYAESLVPLLLAGGLLYLGWSTWCHRLDLPIGTRTIDGRQITTPATR